MLSSALYIPPHRRRPINTSLDGTEFSSKDELISTLGIPQHPSSLICEGIAVRKLEKSVFPDGERIFQKKDNYYNLINIRLGRSKQKFQHYHIKNYYYASADFSIQFYDKILTFGVELNSDKIGGTLTYRDLDLTSDIAVESFCEVFAGAGASTASESEKITHIIQQLLARYGIQIENALRREITEECTPDDAEQITIGKLHYKRTIVETNGQKISIKFVYHSDDGGLKKVREMDIFPMMFEGIETNAYYVYGTGKEDHVYLMKKPYKDINIHTISTTMHTAHTITNNPDVHIIYFIQSRVKTAKRHKSGKTTTRKIILKS